MLHPSGNGLGYKGKLRTDIYNMIGNIKHRMRLDYRIVSPYPVKCCNCCIFACLGIFAQKAIATSMLNMYVGIQAPTFSVPIKNSINRFA